MGIFISWVCQEKKDMAVRWGWDEQVCLGPQEDTEVWRSDVWLLPLSVRPVAPGGPSRQSMALLDARLKYGCL